MILAALGMMPLCSLRCRTEAFVVLRVPLYYPVKHKRKEMVDVYPPLTLEESSRADRYEACVAKELENSPHAEFCLVLRLEHEPHADGGSVIESESEVSEGCSVYTRASYTVYKPS